MNPTARVFIVLVIVSAAVATAALLIVPRRARNSSGGVPIDGQVAGADPTQPDPFVSDLHIPPFTLVDQNGQAVGNEIFSGRVTAVDFIFTNCPFICPTLTATMLSLADRLEGTPVRFVSVSVDPDRDTPEQLRAYAQRNGMDPARWTLLTGDKSVIWGMLENGLKWHIEERPEQSITLADGSKMSNIAHPGWIALVGPDGKLLSICTDIQSEEALELFAARARALSNRTAKKGR